ncbi:hypothetical protein TYRP_011759 [Tyrophagus putrescentiae]|nr:hypothetical protein TYRP_011759 [Tyrophagus putrescentiae]
MTTTLYPASPVQYRPVRVAGYNTIWLQNVCPQALGATTSKRKSPTGSPTRLSQSRLSSQINLPGSVLLRLPHTPAILPSTPLYCYYLKLSTWTLLWVPSIDENCQREKGRILLNLVA